MKTNAKNNLLKMIMLAMLVAIGVIISPILRVEGMCPMAHFINITASVLLGPWWSLLCATLIGIIRMMFMGIPPLALTGAVFGALLSGVFYRLSKGRLIAAVFGEVFGTGIIGAIVSYPVMAFIMGREGLTWLFYVPSFIMGTLIGGSIAFIFLKALAKAKLLGKFQQALGSRVYDTQVTVVTDSIGIAALGVIGYLACLVLFKTIMQSTEVWADIVPYAVLGAGVAAGGIYLLVNRKKIAKSAS